MAPHSFAAGHLPTIASIVKLFPADGLKVYIFGEMNRRFGKSGAMYLDVWPLGSPFLVITSPFLANQVTTTSVAYEKPDALRTWFYPLTGGISIFDAPAEKWKSLRALFVRGFSANHLLSLIPQMVEETEVYCDTLRQHARKGDMFSLDQTTLRFMLDVIGRNAL
jgi:cytochrome P450